MEGIRRSGRVQKRKVKAKAAFKEINRQLKEMQRQVFNVKNNNSPVAKNNVIGLDDVTSGTSRQCKEENFFTSLKRKAKLQSNNSIIQKRKSMSRKKSQNSTDRKKKQTPKKATLQSMAQQWKQIKEKSELEEGELESDDDCVFIEPPQSSLVVLSDEESLTEVTVIPNTNTNAVTSTPFHGIHPQPTENGEMSLFFKDTSRIPWYEVSKQVDGLTELPSADILHTVEKKRKNSNNDVSGIAEFDKTEENLSEITSVHSNSVVIDLNGAEDEETLKENQLSSSFKKDGDDSVIFVSETQPAPNFIPLPKATAAELVRIKPASNNPLNNSQLFTRREKNDLAKYNLNAYNAGSFANKSKKRFIIIDGSNVAFSHSSMKEFSVRGLQICLKHFEKMGHKVKAVVPQHRFKKPRSSDWQLLEQLKEKGLIIVTPCKNLPTQQFSSAYDDRFVLQLAYEMDAAVVSNDNYRDLIFENTAFKKIIENRVLSFAWCEDVFILAKDPYGRHGPTLDMILSC